ncbi:MAG: hypothetical protein MPN21_06605 [Thermoanaerobaculia bacterium]|nr:hypothetical protein [Thermoanaerobaculia bacterium]
MDTSGFLLSLRPSLRKPSWRPASPPLSAVVLALALTTAAIPAAGQVVDNPYLVVARFQSHATNGFLFFDEADGRGRIADRLRDPSEIRIQALPGNLFGLYGREVQPVFGDLHLAPIFDSGGTVRSALFVEASTGYMAYVEELGRNGELGELRTTIGRPFGPISGGDGNFALLPLRGRNGATRGAYLYHGLDGATLFVDDIGELRNDPPVATATTLPPAEGWVSTAELLNDEQTMGFVLLDNATGRVTRVDVSQAQLSRLSARTFSLDLNEAFAAETYNPSPTRFVLVALNLSGPSTTRLLVIDTSTGRLAYLDGLEGNTASLSFLSLNLYQVLRPGIGEVTRVLTPISHQDSTGRTQGVWLIDSQGGRLVYISDVLDPERIEIISVRRQ